MGTISLFADLEPIRLMTGEVTPSPESPVSAPILVAFAAGGAILGFVILAVLRRKNARHPADAAFNRMARDLKLSRRQQRALRIESRATGCHPIAALLGPTAMR